MRFKTKKTLFHGFVSRAEKLKSGKKKKKKKKKKKRFSANVVKTN